MTALELALQSFMLYTTRFSIPPAKLGVALLGAEFRL